MYLPAHFAETRPEVLRAFVRDHPFGLLVTHAHDEIVADGVPFFLDTEPADGPLGVLRAHVARANPLWQRGRGDLDSLVVFQGPQAYVSPAWYASKAEHGKVVPTWNYILVQVRGRLRATSETAWLRAFVGRLTDRHEAARNEPWSVQDAPADYVETMLGAIVGIEITVTSIVGKWKVSQNRSPADRDGVARGLAEETGPGFAALAGTPQARI